MMPTANSVDASPYARFIGYQIDHIDDARARLTLPFRETNCNMGKALHGGVTASLMQAAAMALGGRVLGEAARPWHTCSLEVNYIAAPLGEPIEAEATLLRKGKELCFINLDVRTAEGKAVANGSCIVRGRFGKEVTAASVNQRDQDASDLGPLSQFVHSSAFIKGIGIQVRHMAGGVSRLNLAFREELVDEKGQFHEGAILALLDTTGSMASWAAIQPGPYRSSTVALHAHLLSPVHGEDLVAYGRLGHRDHEIFWSDVEIATAADHRLVARGSVVYRIVIP